MYLLTRPFRGSGFGYSQKPWELKHCHQNTLCQRLDALFSNREPQRERGQPVAEGRSLRVPVILESSKAGYEMYKSCGFTQVGEGSIEYKDETFSWPFMLWDLDN